MVTAAATGYFTALSLILAIGAQNAFVLRQGLLRAHVFAVCLFCALSDAILIAAGVAGFGAIVARWPALPLIMTVAGAAFLIVYGALRLRAAWRGGEALQIGADRPPALGPTLGTIAVLTWANPHVYLDTLGLIGAVSTRFSPPGEKLMFGVAAVAASFSFFFALGYGARSLAPIMRSERSWRVLDAVIGLTMWAIALGLLLSLGA